jgi:threonine/homoserine/homoserine lactone efflux protein
MSLDVFLALLLFAFVSSITPGVMALTAMSLYTSVERPFTSVLLVGVAFALVNVPSVATWAGFGTAMRGFLSDPVRLKRFNIVMGIALALSVVPMVP